LAAKGALGIETLSNELNQYFEKLTKTIYRFGGDIIKVAKKASPFHSQPSFQATLLIF
jgi:hypothetical protein